MMMMMMTVNIVGIINIIFFEWCDDYKKRKAQKASIKEELMPIAWHSSGWWDWCMSENEKKETEKTFLTT